MSPLESPPPPPTRAIPRLTRWASRRSWCETSGASVATVAMIDASAVEPMPLLLVPRGQDLTRRDRFTDVHAVDREPFAVAVVGLHERPDGPSVPWPPSTSLDAVPVPPLKS